jgi:hypothetical protein
MTKNQGGSLTVTVRTSRWPKKTYPSLNDKDAKSTVAAMLDAHNRDEEFKPDAVWKNLDL